MQLGSLAKVQRGGGPNTIYRENARRRIVIRVNTSGGDLSGVVEQIRAAVAEQTFGDVNFHRNRYGELEGY